MDNVAAPGEFHWAVTKQNLRPLLTIYLTAGQQGEVAIVLHGTLGRKKLADQFPLPRLDVVDAARQRGEIAVEVDPAWDVQARDLKQCQTVLASTLAGWLAPKQQAVTQLSLESQGPDYSGTLRLAPREPLVNCDTVTNVRITDRAVEETIVLDYNVQHAGIRQLAFLLPYWLKDARIQVHLLRQKTNEPVDGRPDAPRRVEISLQDAVSGKFRVLIQNDRLLTAAQQQAPIPVVETGRTDRQFVVWENAGRDEVEVVRHPGLEPLGRQQQQWAKLAALLGGNITQAYLVTTPASNAGVAAGANVPAGGVAGANLPQLVLQTRERKALETARARIGLAFTDLTLDDHGAYRAELTCHIDNSTEQYLEIELPEGATLWTAQVAGTAVKPTESPTETGVKSLSASEPQGPSPQKVPGTLSRVRIPLVKTAPGELDYAVVLKYGGRSWPVGPVAEVRFPLVRVLRIPVELSQVRLYLPATHDWFHFGGTMGQVEEAEQTAGQVAYQTKVVNRLMKDMVSSNPYTQARAASNLKQLGLALKNYESSLAPQRGSAATGVGSVKLQEELARNESLLNEAEQTANQVQQTPQQEAQVQDNRFQLNQRFNEQQAQVTGNEVKSAGRNFEVLADEGQVAGSEKPAQYNPQWLERKERLGRDLDEINKSPESGKGMPADVQGRVKGGGKAAGNNYNVYTPPQANEPPAGPQSQLLAPNALGLKGDNAMGDQAGSQAQGAFQPSQRGETQRAKASRYQQEQLQKQAQSVPQPYYMHDDTSYAAGSTGNGRSVSSAQSGPPPKGQEEGEGHFAYTEEEANRRLHGLTTDLSVTPQTGSLARSSGGRQAFQSDLNIPFVPAAQPAGGLASLDVVIPRRGTVYFFSTPRGDAEITAQAVSRPLLTGLVQATAIIFAALVVWYVFVLARRGRFAWLASRRAATVLLALGVVGFCFLPGLAILAILAGTAILVHHLVGYASA